MASVQVRMGQRIDVPHAGFNLNSQDIPTAPSRIFALPALIQRVTTTVEIKYRGRFLCMLWSKDHFESRGVSCLRHPSTRNVEA